MFRHYSKLTAPGPRHNTLATVVASTSFISSQVSATVGTPACAVEVEVGSSEAARHAHVSGGGQTGTSWMVEWALHFEGWETGTRETGQLVSEINIYNKLQG